MRVRGLLSLALLTVASCGGGEPAVYDPAFDSNLIEFSDAMADTQVAYVDTLRQGSDGFGMDLSSGDPLARAAPGFDAALDELIFRQRVSFVAAYELWSAGEPSLHAGPPGEIGRSSEPLLGASAIAGLALFAYAGYTGVRKIVQARAAPVIDRAAEASPEELAIYRDALSLPPTAGASEIQAHFDGLGVSELWHARNQVFSGVNDAVDRNDAGVRPWNAAEESQSVGNAAREAGDLAVHQTVNGLLMVPGSQGVPEAMRGAGLSNAVAETTDILLSVTSSQPLDRFEAIFLNDERSPIEVFAEMLLPGSLAQALLRNADPADADQAIDAAASEVARESGLDSAPTDVHLGRGRANTPMPNAGRGTLLIQPRGLPAQESDVDMTGDTNVRYEADEEDDGDDGGRADAGTDAGPPRPDPDPDADCMVVGGAPIPGGFLFAGGLMLLVRRRRRAG